jgi:hypothetical protein
MDKTSYTVDIPDDIIKILNETAKKNFRSRKKESELIIINFVKQI